LEDSHDSSSDDDHIIASVGIAAAREAARPMRILSTVRMVTIFRTAATKVTKPGQRMKAKPKLTQLRARKVTMKKRSKPTQWKARKVTTKRPKLSQRGAREVTMKMPKLTQRRVGKAMMN
jgi:hypothetical protein